MFFNEFITFLYIYKIFWLLGLKVGQKPKSKKFILVIRFTYSGIPEGVTLALISAKVT
jgi:hypothetical protein